MIESSRIKELQESPTYQKSSIPDMSKGEKPSPIQEKTEELKSQIILGEEILPKMDPGVYKLIGKNWLENGYQYLFQQVEFEPEQYRNMTIEQFPAVVFDFSEIENIFICFRDQWDVLKRLGYEFNFTNYTITLPDYALLNGRCKQLAKEYPGLESFEAVPSEGTAPDAEFIEQFVAGKTILSSDIEFTHDHLGHILPELLMRIEGGYAVTREVVKTVMTPIQNTLTKAKEQIEKITEFNEIERAITIDLNQLTTICAIWIDAKSSNAFYPIKKFDDHSLLLYVNKIYEIATKTQFSEESLWKRYFDSRYPDTPLDRKRSRYLTMLLSIILFPKVVKFDEHSSWSKLNLIKKRLKGINVTWNDDPPRLSFKVGSDKTAGSEELNIEDHPLEVIRLVRNALKITI